MFVGIMTFGSDDLQGGLGRYAHCLLHAMAEVAPKDWKFEAMVRGKAERSLVPRHRHWRAWRSPACVYGDVRSILWHQTVLPAFLGKRRYDAVLLLAASRRIPFPPLVKFASGPPVVGVVHDLAALHVPNKYGYLRDTYALRVLPFMMRGLDRIIAISESTRRDLLNHARLPESRIDVVPLGLDSALFSPGDQARARMELSRSHGIDGPFLFYAARMEHPGKNHLRLIRTFVRMRRRLGIPHRLVLAGKECADGPIRQAVAESGDDVQSLGFVSDQTLVSLYRASTGVVFPSLYEGFGLPVLEAMACGAPVACARIASIPEVAGEAAIYFDPKDEEDMERAMEALLEPARTSELRQAGLQRARLFNWERSAERTLEILEASALKYRR
jgi:glycosyltransferase involved in cell wall biosynthesis